MDFTNLTHAQSLDFSKVQEVTAGQRINFSKDNPNTKRVSVELHWNSDNDGDASIILLGEDGTALKGVILAEKTNPTGPGGSINENKTRGMVWYNNLSVPGAIHTGDVTTSGDDPTEPEETIQITLDDLESEVSSVLIVASTYPTTGSNTPVPFGRLRDCTVNIVDMDTSVVLYTFELSEDFDTFTSVELASFYKRNGEWRYTSMGTGVGKSAQALSDIASKYKLS